MNRVTESLFLMGFSAGVFVTGSGSISVYFRLEDVIYAKILFGKLQESIYSGLLLSGEFEEASLDDTGAGRGDCGGRNYILSVKLRNREICFVMVYIFVDIRRFCAYNIH
ncbi:hypothetical protein D3Z56_06760 [Lachnospiraceae bacterium]|nr:hypothetical protein [Lachnospiraceae bacterium]